MKKIIVKLSNERLITPSGLTLVGGALGKSDLVNQANRMVVDRKRSQPQIKNGDILLTYIGLLCQGKTSFDSVREFHADADYYKAAPEGLFSKGQVLRLIGIGVSGLEEGGSHQMELGEWMEINEKLQQRKGKLDNMMKQIREKYGDTSIRKGS